MNNIEKLKLELAFFRNAVITFYNTFFRAHDTDAFLVAVELMFKQGKEKITKSMELLFYCKSSHVLVLTREVDAEDTYLEEESSWKRVAHDQTDWTEKGFAPLNDLAQCFVDGKYEGMDYQFNKYHVNVAVTKLQDCEDYVVKRISRSGISINAK
jgi:hypothetical protein